MMLGMPGTGTHSTNVTLRTSPSTGPVNLSQQEDDTPTTRRRWDSSKPSTTASTIDPTRSSLATMTIPAQSPDGPARILEHSQALTDKQFLPPTKSSNQNSAPSPTG